MRRNRRASLPWPGRRRSLARARTRGAAFCFGKRRRCARSEGTSGNSVRKVAYHWFAIAFFARHPRVCSTIQRKFQALPFHLPTVQPAGRPRDGRVYIYCASPRRKDARRPNIHSRIERHPRQSQQNDRAIGPSSLLGFKECAPFFPRVKTEVTGTPIRTELQRLDRKVAREKLGLSADIPTLLVMGGSQGASGINQAMIKS